MVDRQQGAGWNACAINTTTDTLNCGPVTVPAGTTQAASTFTVHITSPTTLDTGGLCPDTGNVAQHRHRQLDERRLEAGLGERLRAG